jgi:hypothetical protein
MLGSLSDSKIEKQGNKKRINLTDLHIEKLQEIYVFDTKKMSHSTQVCVKDI